MQAWRGKAASSDSPTRASRIFLLQANLIGAGKPQHLSFFILPQMPTFNELLVRSKYTVFVQIISSIGQHALILDSNNKQKPLTKLDQIMKLLARFIYPIQIKTYLLSPKLGLWMIYVYFLSCLNNPLIQAQSKLYWLNGDSPSSVSRIFKSNTDGTQKEIILDDMRAIFSSLAYDDSSQRLYYNIYHTIFSINTDGSDKRSHFRNEYDWLILEIHIDQIKRKIYWFEVDDRHYRIQRANLDGTEPETVVVYHETEYMIRDFELDPVNGKIYLIGWENWDNRQDKHLRLNLDGTGEEELVFLNNRVLDHLNIYPFSGHLTIAPFYKKIYWTDYTALNDDSTETSKIFRSNFDGSGIEEIMDGSFAPGDLALEINKGKIYWIDKFHSVISANLNGGDLRTIFSLPVSRGPNPPQIENLLLIPDRSTSQFSKNYLNGKVFADGDGNCQVSSDEIGLSNWIIKAEPGEAYAISDFIGEYTLALDSGNYQLSIYAPATSSSYGTIQANCPDSSYTIQLDSVGQVLSGFNWPIDAILCPALKIDVTSDPRIRCFEGQTYISYVNEGLDTARNVKIEVALPEYIIPISANHPWTQQEAQKLTFELNKIPPRTKGQIILKDSIACVNEAFNQTQCVEARIFPQNFCNPHSPNWSQADLTASGECRRTFFPSALLKIKNQGQGDMQTPSSYRIYKRDTLILEDQVQLAAGDSLLLHIPIEGQAIRLEVEQVPHHPRNQQVSVTMMGCGIDQDSTNTTFANQFPQNDDNYEYEVDCQPIVGAYDPNDKLVSPQGFTDQHFVDPGTRMEYTIRFQNTGTFQAFNVRVEDTLSSSWDMTSFEMQSASHDYNLEFRPDGSGNTIAIWSFPDINLPDSTSNEPESHGYIKFKISPLADLPIGTPVENFADIFFDFNDPIRTNTTLTTFEEYVFPSPLVPLDPCTLVSEAEVGDNLSLCPGEAQLNAQLPETGKGSWSLLQGQALIEDPSSPTSMVNDLAPGDYTFRWSVSPDICSGNFQDFKISVKTPPSKPLVENIQGNLLQSSVEGDSYQWFRNDSLLNTQGRSLEASISGEYRVRVISAGCESPFSESYSFLVTALEEELARQYGLSIQPNPTEGALHIHLDTWPAQEMEVRLRDLNGKLLNRQILSAQNRSELDTELDLESLNPGLYFLEIQWDGGKITRKIVRN